MQRLRVGVVGVGGIARWHIRGYQRCEGMDVVAAADVRTEALEQVREAFGIAHTYTDYREMLAKEALDLVSVCTPNDMHYPVAMAAIERGLDVYCEKPLALTLEQAREMATAAAEAGIRTGVNFSHRITPASRFAREILTSGALGAIFRVAAVYAAGWPQYAERPFTWRNDAARAGFGGMGDMGSHIMDMMLWWLDTDVTSLAAHAKTFVPERADPIRDKRVKVTTEDQGSLLLQYGNGAMGYLCGSYVFTGRGYDQRAEVYGSEGGLMYDQQRPYELQLWLPEEQMAPFTVIRRGGVSDRPYHTVLVPERLHGKDEAGPRSIVEAFAQSLQTGQASDLVPTFEDGLRVQEVLEASARAAASRAWVDLPL